MKQTILFTAPIKTRSGYGDHARDLAYSILKGGSDKYTLYILPTYWGNTPWTGLDVTTEKGRQINECIVETPPPVQPDIFIQLTIPNEFQPVGKYNIGVTAGIETDLCAPDWIEGCNRMDMVITTSNHSLTVLKESKFDAHDKQSHQYVSTLQLKPDLKLEVLFEGVDTSIFTSENRSLTTSSLPKFLDSISENFCFLFVGHWLEGNIGEDRKDVGMLIHTFGDIFSNKPASTRPALILKTSSGASGIVDKEKIKEKINKILKPFKVKPSIYLLHGDLTDEEMNILYHHSKIKAMVSFTHGEGFGRPMLEFGVTGKPIIASNWSGHVDFLEPASTLLLPGTLQPVHNSAVNQWILKEAKWFRVDYNFAKQALNSIYTQYKNYTKVSINQKRHVLSNYTLEKMTEVFMNILSKVNVPIQIVLPSNEPTPLSTFSLPKIKKLE